MLSSIFIKLSRILVGTAITAAFVGCASAPSKRQPTQYLYSTDKSTTNLLKDLRDSLVEKKYKIRKIDVGAGLLITEPRSFSYGEDDKKAKQILNIRQEGASVKVAVSYTCLDDSGKFIGCYEDNEELALKIKRVESPIIKIIRDQLTKRKKAAALPKLDNNKEEENNAKDSGESEEDTTSDDDSEESDAEDDSDSDESITKDFE